MLSLIPISDANPTHRKPFVTIGLILGNLYMFFQQPDFGRGAAATRYFVQNAPIPCQLPADCPAGFAAGVIGPQQVAIPERPLTSFLVATLVSIFLHAGFLHIGGNMLFLWVFGNNVEDHLGHVKFLLFYLTGGVVAALAHVFTHLDSVLPAVGASGAVAAVMGAYIVLFPRARVNVLVPIFIIFTVVQLSAIVVLGLWFLYQFLIGAQEFSGATEVAWMAHVGGFVFGAIGIFALGGRPHRPRSRWERRWQSR